MVKEIFVISKIKNTAPWTYVVSDVSGEKIVRTSYEKELQKTNQKEFRREKVIKRKGNKLYVKWEGYDNSFNSRIDKKRHCIKMSQYFPKSYEPFGRGSNVKVDWSNDGTELDLKNLTGIDTSKLAAKSHLASLKAEVDKINIDKLKTVPINLSKH